MVQENTASMDNTFNAVSLIQTIANKLRDKKLKNISTVEKEIAALGRYLGTSQMQTVIFVAIFDRTSGGSASDTDDIARYFECSSIDIVAHKKDFDALLFGGLIEKAKMRHECSICFTNINFRVPAVVFEAILGNEPISEAKSAQGEPDHFDMVKQIGEWLEERDREDVSTASFLSQSKELEESFLSCPFVLNVRQLLPDIVDRVLFYDICKDSFIDGCNSSLESTLKDLFDHRSQALREMKNFIKGEAVLQKFGLVECWPDDDEYRLALSNKGYELLLGEYAEVKMKKINGLDKFEFVKAVSDSVSQRKKRNLVIQKLMESVSSLEHLNGSLTLVKEATKLLKEPGDRIFFYEMCNDSLTGRTCLESTLGDIFDKPQKVLEESVKWKNEEHPLQTLGLAEMGEESFFGSTRVELTDEGRELFLQEDADKFKTKEKTNDILSVDKIKEKHLFFSPALRKQVDFLSESIQPDAFEQLQDRLKEKGLPVGVAAIFYGTPGTGKTETVYQLAKASGRDVMQVDISEMKTCWYGESQKLVKGVFSKYERMCKKSRKAPILLFNEADAVFSRRNENTSTSIDQTENAIQNIILEQMEKLQGILIATTNMEGNLDPAFERRFLFKVKFEKPGVDAKMLIWKDKLQQITSEEAMALAAEFDFSGGEIDNIVRKATMNDVLKGEGYSLDYIRELCSQEHLIKKCGNVGFRH